MGSREGKILCKLFAAQKSAKIDAWGMKGTWGETRFFVLLSCDLQGSSMSIIQLNGALQGDHGSLAAAPAHIRVPKLTHIAVPR